MNDLEKFKQTVSSLEQEMTDLSNVADVYKKVAEAGDAFTSSIEKTNTIVSELEKSTSALNNHAKIMEEIKNNLDAIKQGNKDLKNFIMVAIAVGFVAVVIGIVLLAK